MQRIIGSFFGAFLAVVMVSLGQDDHPGGITTEGLPRDDEHLVVRSLVLADEEGRVRAQLRMVNGMPTFGLLDAQGTARLVMAVSDEETKFVAVSAGEDAGVGMTAGFRAGEVFSFVNGGLATRTGTRTVNQPFDPALTHEAWIEVTRNIGGKKAGGLFIVEDEHSFNGLFSILDGDGNALWASGGG